MNRKTAETNKTKDHLTLQFDGTREESVGQRASVAARATSHCGPRYAVSGREGGSNLLEKNCCCEQKICGNKETNVISPCNFDGSQEEGVG